MPYERSNPLEGGIPSVGTLIRSLLRALCHVCEMNVRVSLGPGSDVAAGGMWCNPEMGRDPSALQ